MLQARPSTRRDCTQPAQTNLKRLNLLNNHLQERPRIAWLRGRQLKPRGKRNRANSSNCRSKLQSHPSEESQSHLNKLVRNYRASRLRVDLAMFQAGIRQQVKRRKCLHRFSKNPQKHKMPVTTTCKTSPYLLTQRAILKRLQNGHQHGGQEAQGPKATLLSRV